MKKTIIISAACAALLMCFSVSAKAQVSAVDSVFNHSNGNRLSIGGYGEIAYSRNFYSDNPFRYSSPDAHKNDGDHGRFDIPHAVIYLGYDFGKGWSFGTEIEFEHGGSGAAIEQENEEAGEWEHEIEKGGEVELEQFWIQKSFAKWANLRFGHIVVPIGLTNAYHEPLNFFTVYRSEGENTILPCTWHQTGVSFFGRMGDFRYEAQFIAGLNAFMFNRENWIQKGAHSPYEFEIANRYGVAARVDNYTIKGLRLGLSAYYGQSMHNAFPNDMSSSTSKYKDVKGNIYLGAFDFTYNDHNWIARGNVDYGYVSDMATINVLKKNNAGGDSPYSSLGAGSHAIATSIEVGYDIFSQIAKMRADRQKLYIFGHYEYYDSFIHASDAIHYTKKNIFAAGVNYYPVPQIAIKAEYSYRKLSSQFNSEPAINIGVAYQGFFL